MASTTVSIGKFLLVDLLTATGLYVATVPDCWVFEGNKCYYPRSTGDARIAAMKREPFKPNWEIYSCTVRKAFNSYEASRSQENQATIQTDISSESDQQTMGRGKRNKRAPGRYLPTEPIQDGCSSDDSYDSIGMYGPTQPPAQQAVFNTPAIPPGLFSKAASQQTNDSTIWNQPFPFESTPAPLQPAQPSTFPNHPNRIGGVEQSISVSSNYACPEVELSEGSKAVLAKLVKEVIKLEENISNVMSKMVVIDGKMDVLMTKPTESQATEQQEMDPDFLPEPLKEIEEVKLLEEILLDNDKYYQLVTIIRNLGGGSITSAVKRAWCRVFSIKVMAFVNWKGVATKNHQKQGLKKSIITKAIFEAVRNTGGRRAKDYELEKLTKSVMRGMPEKFRKSLQAAADMEEDNEDDMPPPTGGSSS